MPQSCAIELIEDKGCEVVWIEFWHEDGEGNSGFNVLVDGEMDITHQIGLADEDEVVIFWEVLEEEPQFSQAFDVHQMSIINDGSDHFAEVIEAEGFLN